MSGSGKRGREIVRLRPASSFTPDEARLRLFVRLYGLGKPQGAVVANLNYDDHEFLYRGSRGGSESVRNTGNHQHRRGQSIHQPRAYGAAEESPNSNQHRWQRMLAGQRVC